MCGIAGIVHLDGRPAAAEPITSMIEALAHRGPDESGRFWGEGVALAHTRLSLLDLAHGQQPMTADDLGLHITFNGEIFNHDALRTELQQLGHRFATRSDTEVVLRSYGQWGAECLRRFNGQWAFAIWNSRDRSLFAARDRIGIRPFYYTEVDGQFAFASEMKALIRHPQVTGRLDPEAMAQIFTFWCTVAPRTPLAGIQQLPPGSYLSLHKGRIEVSRYWQLDYQIDRSITDEAAAAEELEHLLGDSIDLRLQADVPIGAYLSGGLDSSLLTAMMHGKGVTNLQTFSLGFENPELDESAYQRAMVEQTASHHHEIRCANGSIGEQFRSVVWHAETPLIRTAPSPLRSLAELVRGEGIKAVLTGEGADEILAGYDLFREAKVRRFWARDPESTMRPQLLRRLYPYMPRMQSQPLGYLKRFFRSSSEEQQSPFFSHLPRWALTARVQSLFSEAMLESVGDYDPMAELAANLPDSFDSWSDLGKAQYLESSILLPGYILSSQGDRMSMAHSVEGRYPFLDHRLVEWAGRLPDGMKLRGLDEKYILKKVAAGKVPASIVKRPKQPYRAPDSCGIFHPDHGFRAPDEIEDLLTQESIEATGIFSGQAVDRLLNKVRSGRALGVADNMAIVGVVSTQLFVQQFAELPQLNKT